MIWRYYEEERERALEEEKVGERVKVSSRVVSSQVLEKVEEREEERAEEEREEEERAEEREREEERESFSLQDSQKPVKSLRVPAKSSRVERERPDSGATLSPQLVTSVIPL